MMFTPTTMTHVTYDPIERARVESGRPASRIEVIQHQQRSMRQDTIAMAIDAREDVSSSRRSVLEIVPESLDGIRRSLSRLLHTAGQRIGPEAA